MKGFLTRVSCGEEEEGEVPRGKEETSSRETSARSPGLSTDIR